MNDTTSTPSGSTTTGPATFAEASWGEPSSAATPPSDSQPTDSASASATETPVSQSTPDGAQPQQNGEPPKERWADILANARQKAAEEALAPYAWAKQVDQSSLNEAVRIAQLSKADPIAYMQEFIKDLQANPTYGAQLKSLAAKALAARSQSAEPQEPQPDLPIQLEDGRVVHLYSAEQQAKREAYLQQRWLAQVKQEFEPVVKTHDQLQQQAAAMAKQREIASYVDSTFTDVKTWPGMDSEANQKAVAQALASMQVNEDDPREVSLALNAAYRQVVLPTLSQKAESKLLDTLQHKAAASTGINPGTAAASTPRTVRKFSDLPPEAWR